MEYKTNLTCSISIYHYSSSVPDIENAIGRKATKSINCGDPRPRSDSPPFDRNVAHFEIVPEKVVEPQAAISDCLDLIENSADIDTLNGGSVWIVLGLLDPSFVQVVLNKDVMKRLGDANVELSIENRHPVVK